MDNEVKLPIWTPDSQSSRSYDVTIISLKEENVYNNHHGEILIEDS